MLVELQAFRDAMVWGVGFHYAGFFGDVKVVIDKVNARISKEAKAGEIFQEVRLLLDAYSGFSDKFLGTQKNRVAHLVAKKAIYLFPTGGDGFDFRVWLCSEVRLM
ncbi:unnamed protein product [Linum trigynum]|uniref:RNase H type-1 domain-containing protein n=1 Tax=Linum trigynum TaxID=586398 RepID=A0AAV2CKT6_9ROSI